MIIKQVRIPHPACGLEPIQAVLDFGYLLLGKYREAVQMADRGLDLSLKSGDADNITEAYVDKAYWLLVGHNEREEVKKALARAAETNAGANFVYYRLFNIYLLMGEYEKTSPLLKSQLLTMSPFGNLSVSASVHRARREYDAAIMTWKRSHVSGL